MQKHRDKSIHKSLSCTGLRQSVHRVHRENLPRQLVFAIFDDSLAPILCFVGRIACRGLRYLCTLGAFRHRLDLFPCLVCLLLTVSGSFTTWRLYLTCRDSKLANFHIRIVQWFETSWVQASVGLIWQECSSNCQYPVSYTHLRAHET